MKAENVGRSKLGKLLKDIGYVGVSFTKGTYDKYDADGKRRDGLVAFEIKNRYADYDTWWVNMDKLKVLAYKIIDDGYKDAYFTIFYKKKAYLYEVKDALLYAKAHPECSVVRMKPATTTGDNNEMVPFRTFEIPTNVAYVYECSGGKWQLKTKPNYS